MRSEIIRELQSEYQEQQQRDRLEDDRREAEAAARDPNIAALIEERRNIILSSLRGILDKTAIASDLPDKMSAKNEEIRTALAAAGFPPDYLEPTYCCPDCKDTGYVGSNVKEMCSCMKAEFYRRLYREVGLNPKNPQTFQQFDLSLFSDSTILTSAPISQRALMKKYRSFCEKWADTYPDVATPDIFMLGSSGLGKTFLMNCIANRLLERGFNVLVISAYKFLEIARQSYFSLPSEKSNWKQMEDLISADVLMIDDVGSEPLMENITVSQFFNLLNERQVAGRSTIISTNLTMDEFKQRYTERVASRLLDESKCCRMQFEGSDVRENLGKRKQGKT